MVILITLKQKKNFSDECHYFVKNTKFAEQHSYFFCFKLPHVLQVDRFDRINVTITPTAWPPDTFLKSFLLSLAYLSWR